MDSKIGPFGSLPYLKARTKSAPEAPEPSAKTDRRPDAEEVDDDGSANRSADASNELGEPPGCEGSTFDDFVPLDVPSELVVKSEKEMDKELLPKSVVYGQMFSIRKTLWNESSEKMICLGVPLSAIGVRNKNRANMLLTSADLFHVSHMIDLHAARSELLPL